MKKVLSFMLVLCMLLGLVACGSNPVTEGSSSTPVEETTKAPEETTSDATEEKAEAVAEEEPTSITIGLVGEPDTLVPYIFTSDKESLVQMQLFDYLFQTDETGATVPNLVESVEFDEATLTYTWKINQNAVWSDGEPLTIDDVIFTLNSLAAPEYTGGTSNSVLNIAGYAEVNSGAFT